MGYSMSFDASLKVKSADAKGLLKHNFRDVDKKNGIEVNHANENINAELTGNNKSFYYDSETGKHKRCSDTNQIVDALDERLATVKKPLRKDAVVLRPFILQLDPQWYRDNPDSKKNPLGDAMDWANEVFGKENIVGLSSHEDEENPHIHVMFTPVTEDGRLSQKDWFTGPDALRKMHESLRSHMNDRGYEVDMKNKKPGKHAKRMSVNEYKDYKDLENERKALAAENERLIKKEENLMKLERDLFKREDDIFAKKDKLDSREQKLDERESKLDTREKHLNAQIDDYHQKLEDLPNEVQRQAQILSERLKKELETEYATKNQQLQERVAAEDVREAENSRLITAGRNAMRSAAAENISPKRSTRRLPEIDYGN